MLLSRTSQYAVSGVLRLAALPSGGFCRVEDLVRGTSAPRHAVAKVFQALVKRNILDSARGAGGGFRLSPRGLDLSLMDVVEAVEGPFERSQVLERGLCASDESCPMHRVLQPLADELQRVLRTTRVRDVLAQGPRLTRGCCGAASSTSTCSGGATP